MCECGRKIKPGWLGACPCSVIHAHNSSDAAVLTLFYLVVPPLFIFGAATYDFNQNDRNPAEGFGGGVRAAALLCVLSFAACRQVGAVVGVLLFTMLLIQECYGGACRVSLAVWSGVLITGMLIGCGVALGNGEQGLQRRSFLTCSHSLLFRRGILRSSQRALVQSCCCFLSLVSALSGTITRQSRTC